MRKLLRACSAHHFAKRQNSHSIHHVQFVLAPLEPRLLLSSTALFGAPVNTTIVDQGSTVFADMNHDGKSDVVYTAGSSLSVAVGNGDGTFQAAHTYSMDGANTDLIARLGVAGTSNADVVATIPSLQEVEIFPGNGDGTLGSPIRFSAAYAGSLQLRVGDFNADGIKDILIISVNSIQVFLGTGNGHFNGQTPQFINLDLRPFSISIGDYNNDGKQDLVFGENHNPTLILLQGQGNGAFNAPVFLAIETQPPAPPNGHAASTAIQAIAQTALRDINGDGKQDIVFLGLGGTASLSILYGSGNGTFSNQLTYDDPPGQDPFSLFDINGDGMIDVVYGDSYLLGSKTNTGLEAFGASKSIPFYNGSGPLGFGDFDGDGRMDAFNQGGISGSTVIRFNLSAGRAFAPTSFVDGNGTLNVIGADNNDSIHASLFNGQMMIGLDGIFASYSAAGINKIEIVSGLGANSILVDNNIADDALIYSFGPNSTVAGGAGNDTILGANGDFLEGNAGNDLIQGEQQEGEQLDHLDNDTIFGGPGNDTITLGNHGFVIGGAGDDSISGSMFDTLWGGYGNDTISDIDFLDGGPSLISAGPGNDLIETINKNTNSPAGNTDTIYGGGGDDTAHIDQGVDLIINNSVEDILYS